MVEGSPQKLRSCWSYGFLTLGVAVVSSVALAGDEHAVSFDRDVLPILTEHCYPCHGPDEAARSTELRLDQRDFATADLGGYSAIVPGDANASEAIRRILSDDEDEVMPPPDAKLELSESARSKLVEWVEAGAPWEAHWAFTTPANSRSTSSTTSKTIDDLVREQLAEVGLAHAPPADRRTLLRRASIGLTGLPPTPEAIAAFEADQSHDAYERVVEQLLASDACAEWLALEWMDVARYADSHGLHADGLRTSWPWRDWVIGALRENLPYDEFVTWQLAGDLLPNASREQRLATAFLRNHPMTGEGGVIDEEFRWNYVFDRTETTGTALLGLTLNCCRCHDHKFDPISQREYFQFAAFFNNVREIGMTGDDGDYGPLLPLPSDSTGARISALRRAIDEIDGRIASLRNQTTEQTITAGRVSLPTPVRRLRLEKLSAPPSIDGEAAPGEQIDGAEFVTHRQPPEFVEGVRGSAASIDGEYGYFELADSGLIDVADALSVAMWIQPEPAADSRKGKTQQLIGNAGDKNTLWRGWELLLDAEQRLTLTLTSGRPANRIAVRTVHTIPASEWTHVAFAYDGSGRAAGVRLYVGGLRQSVDVVDDRLTRSIYPVTNEPDFPRDEERKLRVGRSHRKFLGDDGIYNGAIDELQLYDVALTDAEVATLFDEYDKGTQRSSAVDTLNSSQWARHHQTRDNQELVAALRDRRTLLAMRVELATATPQVMVMREESEPQETRVLSRGQYDLPGERVDAGTPEAVGEFVGYRPDRLGLAQWVFADDNPVAARVAVNRYWQLLFGRGLVETPHDFGIQGERPTHPELLDALAIGFRESRWDLRWLLRTMVTSQTYRQSSSVRDWRVANASTESDPLTIDPENRLLWRGPSRRLKAEALRDSALAASGLLNRRVGGPSVRPYQPQGLWEEKSSFSQALLQYKPSSGDDLYRRSLYTFVRRTSPPPAMEVFDAPNRSTCVVQRETTNTPLQALVLLNDPQFVEAARVLAERVLGKETNADEQIAQVFVRLTGIEIGPAEASRFSGLYRDAMARFESDPDQAESLLAVGESPPPTDDAAEVAALTVVASTIMNYDAFYMAR